MENYDELLGRTIRLKAIGNIKPDYSRLGQKFEKYDSIINFFCSGCGTVFELNKEQASALASEHSQALPEDFGNKYYFKSNGCGVCDGNAENLEIEILEN